MYISFYDLEYKFSYNNYFFYKINEKKLEDFPLNIIKEGEHTKYKLKLNKFSIATKYLI